ncbi:MAG: hypothetical protein ACSLE2_08765 [Lysobacterales bacterium]
MTTAYAQRPPQERRQYVPGSLPRLVSSAPAQGQEARKMRENVHAISVRTVARGHSAESAKLNDAVRDLAESIEALPALIQNWDEGSYKHVPLKPVFTIQVTYKRIGKLKPRQFRLDE